MEILIGLLIIAVGSFGQSSSYVPIKKVKNWSWESFWLTQGIFAWLVFPFLWALLAIPENISLGTLLGAGGATGAVIYGMLWGVGGLTFGLSMRYLGTDPRSSDLWVRSRLPWDRASRWAPARLSGHCFQPYSAEWTCCTEKV